MTIKFNVTKIIDGPKKKNIKEDFENDYVVKSMGAIGRWQWIVCSIVGFSRLLAAYNVLSVFFLTPSTDYTCVRFSDNSTREVQVSVCYHDCLEYEFHSDAFNNSLISEFGLICERKWLASFTQTVLMFGLVLGVSFFGWVSDRFGRSKSLIISGLIDLVFMYSAPFAPDFWTFTAIRFLSGIASGGILATTTVYIMEMVGPQHKEMAGAVGLMPDGVSEASLAMFAYFSSSWKVLLLMYTGLCTLIMVAMLFLPESPRWLVANGKLDEAVALMTKAAKFNNMDPKNIKENVMKAAEELKLKDDEAMNHNYLDLVKTKKLFIITMSSVTVWFVTGLCYFGINQYVSIFGVNIFIVVGIVGLLQLPVSLLTSVLLKIFGRKRSTIGSLGVVTLTMVILIFLPKGWISSLVGIIGASAACLVFDAIYIYVTELYPTPVRSMGLAVSSAFSKVGAMIAPFIANIEPTWVASATFAALPFVAIAFCLLLPETKGKKLRDDLEEVEKD